MPISVYIAAGLVVLAIQLAWWSAATRTDSGASARRHLHTAAGGPVDLREIELARSAQDRILSPLVSGLARKGRRITPSGVVESLERRIDLAGVGERWPIDKVLAAKAIGSGIAATFGLLRFASAPTTGGLVLAIALVAAGYFLPDLLLAQEGAKRKEAITRALPDMLDQLSINVEAGLGFEAALARLARGSTEPLQVEIARTLQDIKLGMARPKAFEALVARTEVPDLRQFVHAFLQAERNGIPIAQVLRIQSGEMRAKRRTRAEERAQKLPVKMIFPLATCILPAMFLVLMTPTVMKAADMFNL